MMMFLWLLLENMLGVHSWNMRYYPYFILAGLTIPAAGILLPIWRKKVYGFKGLTFKEAFQTGLIVTAVLMVTFPIIYGIFFSFIAPDTFDNIRDFAFQHAHRFGMRPNVAMHRAGLIFTLQNYIIVSFLGTIAYGVLMSGLGSYLFRTK